MRLHLQPCRSHAVATPLCVESRCAEGDFAACGRPGLV